MFAGGLRSLGPLLIAMGSPLQQHQYLPAILDGSDLWCQGFSEPGAGSDLAALQTRAVATADHYVVNGSKIWTTGAHIANRMFCLVRTAQGAKTQYGITFLLVDMAAAGVSVRPIRTLDGDNEFNEVFLDNVRVPLANRVGAENEGWGVAKRLMSFARANNTTSGVLRRALRRATGIFQSHGADSCALRLCQLECELRAFEALELRVLSQGQANGVTAVQASMIKTLATELHQKVSEVALDAAGPAAQAFQTDGTAPSLWLDEGRFAVTKYLATRAASIYSGTNETHRNLMSGHLHR